MITDCARTVDKIVKQIPGKTSVDGLTYLCELTAGLDVPGYLVDLGTYHGRSAFVMVQGTLGNQQNRKVITIDDYSEGPNAKDDSEGKRPDFWTVKRRLKCRGRVQMLFDDTARVPPLCQISPVALVFEDSDHREPHLREVIAAWKPIVTPGGLFLFDDYGSERWPDVQRVVDELMGDWERLECKGSVVAFRRPDDD